MCASSSTLPNTPETVVLGNSRVKTFVYRSRALFRLLILNIVVGTFVFLSSCGSESGQTKCEQLQVGQGAESLTIGYMPPIKGMFGAGDDTTLVVYLHGLGAAWQQPFMLPQRHTYASTANHFKPGTAFLSPQYSTAEKCLDSNAIANITSSIKKVSEKQPFKKIVLSGCSMGASAALCYATQAPPEIRDKIVGVIAMYAAGDMVELHDVTGTALVRSALENCFGGSPRDPKIRERYLSMSVSEHMDEFPKNAKVYVISALADATIPPNLQKKLVKAFNEHSIPVRLEEIQAPHEIPPSHKSFTLALKYILD